MAFLRARLEERNADARERAVGFLEDTLGLLKSDLDRALRTLVRFEAALAGLVDAEQRCEMLERSVDVRRSAAVALGRQGRHEEAARQFERLVSICRELGQGARSEQYAVLARRYAEAPPGCGRGVGAAAGAAGGVRPRARSTRRRGSSGARVRRAPHLAGRGARA